MIILKRVLRSIDAVSKHSGIFAWLIIPMCAIMTYEVVVRYGFNAPTIWANDLSKLIFGVYFVIGGGYTLVYDGHVRVDVLFRRLSLRKQAILNLVTSSVFFLPFVVVLLIEVV